MSDTSASPTSDDGWMKLPASDLTLDHTGHLIRVPGTRSEVSGLLVSVTFESRREIRNDGSRRWGQRLVTLSLELFEEPFTLALPERATVWVDVRK